MRISDWSSDVCSSDLGHVHQISWGGSLVLLHVFPDNLPTGKCSDPGSRMRPQISSKRSFVKVFTVVSGNRRIQQVPLYEPGRSEEQTSELQSLMRISYAVFCLKKKTQ